jgi:hypothetical protein
VDAKTPPPCVEKVENLAEDLNVILELDILDNIEVLGRVLVLQLAPPGAPFAPPST